MRLRAVGLSDTGRVRPLNEDSFLVDEAASLFVLADGMGGHNAGEVASREACRAFAEAATAKTAAGGAGASGAADAMRDAFAAANRSVFDMAAASEALRGMGATFVACRAAGGRAVIVHAGDARAYLLREGRLERLTEDHSLVAELVRSGHIPAEEAADHPLRNRVTKALGVKPEEEPGLREIEPREGDEILLCSDGLWGALGDSEIADALASASGIADRASALIGRANEAGGHDNITVILIQFGERGTR